MSKKLKKQRSKAPAVKPDTYKERNAEDLQYREATIIAERSEGSEDITVKMSVSSEEPVLTYTRYNDTWQNVYEILDHSESSIKKDRMRDGLVIQDTHFGDQVGLIRKVEIRDRKMGGEVEFCTGRRAQDIARDAEKGLRKNCSVGYIVDMESYEKEGEKDGYPVVRAKCWTPYEASFVPIPADTSVGVGRELKPAEKAAKTKNERGKTMDPKEIAKLYKRAAEFGIDVDKVEGLIDNHEERDAKLELEKLITEKQRVEINTVNERNKELEKKKPETPEMRNVAPIGGDVETEKKIARKYSVINVLRAAAGIKADSMGNKVDIGFETEINDEARSHGLGSQRGGEFIIPHGVLASRDLSVSGTSSATVATNLLVDEFIDMLRSKVILGPLGCRFLTGLSGNVAVSKQSGAATGYWLSEGEDVTESQPSLGQVTGTPHTCGALVDITRRMLLQSTPAAEMLVRDDILNVIGRTIQTAVFAGTGSDGQPSAITTASGINNPSISSPGTPTYAEILSFIGNILTDNAEGSAMKWAMTAEVWETLCSTTKDSGSGQFVLDPDKSRMLGYEYVQPCSDLPDNSLWFGDWSTVMLGIWGAGIDLIMDTATLSSSGGLRIVGLQDIDIMVRNGQALSYNTAVTS